VGEERSLVAVRVGRSSLGGEGESRREVWFDERD
jgi:hypothetical protein